MASIHRLSVTEYEDDSDAILQASEQLGVRANEVVRMLNASNERLRRQFSAKNGPLIVREETLRVENLAGLLRLSPSVELEIAPKFLGARWPAWRSDFFVVASLSQRGYILPSERLRAGTGDRGDLATLVARTIIEMYWDLHRKPLRTYTREEWSDTALDGEADPEDLVRPTADGFKQSSLRLTRRNVYGQAIHDAAAMLVGEVRDAQTKGQLLRVVSSLAPQNQSYRGALPRQVPSRQRAWQGLFELACQVLAGFGVNLDTNGGALSPGYVVRTPKAWEDLLFAAARLGLPNVRVTAQAESVLGTRNGRNFTVRPDLSIVFDDVLLLADAKYKGRAGDGPTSPDAADVYESLAFMAANGCDRLAMLYPRPARASDEAPQLGKTSLTETIVVGDRTIYALEVELRGISQRSGMQAVSRELGGALRSLIPADAGTATAAA